ncbi:glycosyltransferase family 2 protein [Kineococcus sp. SYSU DK004]|uniref:glycosyltransferase family 2 protein n=1 Tax=Kineococcus sp. SYSU DK004 TaxID=3383125 RepID=UPI003D7D79C5
MTVDVRTEAATDDGAGGAAGPVTADGRVRHPADPARSFDAELVLVSYKSAHQLRELLAGLPEQLPVVVVDNACDADGVRAVVEARPRGRYVDSGGGKGFARAANLGARSSTHEFVVFGNPDSRPTVAAFAQILADVADDPTCAASAATMVGVDGHVELGVGGWEPTVRRALVHSAGLHKLMPRAGLYAKPRPGEDLTVDWTTGACMAVRRSTFVELGGFDEEFYVYNEDMAFGRAARERGLHEKLRTDVLVPHAAGGSGAPSLEMLRLRGAAMSRYLARHHGAPSHRLLTTALAAGYAVRAAQRTVLRQPDRASQHWAYVKGVTTGRASVAGKVVMERSPRVP